MAPKESAYWRVRIEGPSEARLWGLLLSAAIALNRSTASEAAKTIDIPYRRLLAICNGAEMDRSEFVAVRGYLAQFTEELRFEGRQSRSEIKGD